MWTLTYSVEGNRRVEVIPRDLVGQLTPLVERCKEYRDAVKELGVINAQLLRLWRGEQRNRTKKSPTPGTRPGRASRRRR